MGKSVPYVFLALSIAFFLFLVGLTGYRIETTRRSNAAIASALSGDLLATTKALRDVNGSFNSPYFKSKMRDAFNGQPRLLVLAIYTMNDGIVYLIARNKSYLVDPVEVSPAWRGRPSYRSSPGFETLFTLSYPLVTPDGEQMVIMDSLFVIFGREDLYPILRDDLYLLLSFLIVCGIFILIAANVQDSGKELPSAAGAARAPAPMPFPTPPPLSAEPIGAGGFTARASVSAQVSAPVGAQVGTSDVSPESGLVRVEFFAPRLKNEIQRAAASDEDVSVACVQIDGPAYGEPTASLSIAIANVLLGVFPFHDLIFETGGKSYALILPDSDIDRSFKSLEELRTRIAGAPLEGRNYTASIGVSSRAGRLIEDTTLHQEAVVSLQKALREGGNRVVGFRASPSKFRQVLSGLEG
jgi:GGDEF domain-containing protein